MAWARYASEADNGMPHDSRKYGHGGGSQTTPILIVTVKRHTQETERTHKVGNRQQ